MPDQTPVTDDERKAHEWCDGVDTHPNVYGDQERAAARAIRAHVPAPPATLADELREWLKAQHTCAILEWQWDRLDSLADRAEAVEKENRDMERELNNAWDERDDALVGVVRLTRERDAERQRNDNLTRGCEGRDAAEWKAAHDEARAEVERLRKELGEERSKVHESSRVEDEAVSLSCWLSDALGEHVDDQDNETLVGTVQRLAERLTRERDHERAEVERLTTQVGRQQQLMTLHGVPRDTVILPDVETTPALPDPADVPDRTMADMTSAEQSAVVGMWCEYRRHGSDEPEGWVIPYGYITGAGRIPCVSPAAPDPTAWAPDPWMITPRPDLPRAWNADGTTPSLVPDVRRVIDRVEDLDKLPRNSVVRDEVGDRWTRLYNGKWAFDWSIRTSVELLRDISTSVTLIYVPEVTA